MSDFGAVILAFPIARRCDFVSRLAAQMTKRSAEQAERHLATKLRRSGAALRRKGLTDIQVRRELTALVAAMHREIWRVLLLAPTPRNGQRGAGG
jgi:muconolactone delta-isomerase